MSNYNIDAIKQDAIQRRPLAIDIPLGEIKIPSLHTATVAGQNLELDEQGLMALQSVCRIDSNTGYAVGQLLGEESQVILLNALKNAISEQKKSDVTLFVTENGKIVDFDHVRPRLTTEDYFELVDYIINRYNLNVDKASVGQFGEVSISTKANGSYRISKLENEVFNGGVGFNFSASGILDLVRYLWRQICTNGMMGEVEHRDFTVNTVNKDRLMRLMERLDDLAKTHFIDGAFSQNVQRAMAVYASVHEMEQVEKMIRQYSVTEKNQFNNWFIPGDDIRREYAKIGWSVSDMSAAQKKHAATNLKVWDVINGLTDFASHRDEQAARGYSFTEYDGSRMMRDAGSMLAKTTYDMQAIVPCPFELKFGQA